MHINKINYGFCIKEVTATKCSKCHNNLKRGQHWVSLALEDEKAWTHYNVKICSTCWDTFFFDNAKYLKDPKKGFEIYYKESIVKGLK